MSRGRAGERSRGGAPDSRRLGPRVEATLAGLLLAAHALLAGWGVFAQSVTFDENFHVPAGVVHAARGDAGLSTVNPPLVKLLFGAAALAAGAEMPADSAITTRDQAAVGESFMRVNARRYARVYAAARSVSLALSLLLGLLVWRAARTRGGPRAGLLAMSLWAFAPEALAHAGVASMDVATALGWCAFALALDSFLRRGRWRDWGLLAGASVFLSLVRFSALLAPPVALAALALAAARGRLASPRTAIPRMALVLPVVWLALGLAYAQAPITRPVSELAFRSARLRQLADAAPWVRLPVPETMAAGLDRQLFDGEPGHLTTYVLGRPLAGTVPWYFPFAIAVKWPLTLLLALLARGALAVVERGRCGSGLWLPATAFLAGLALLGAPNAGVRYALPLVPLVAIACGDLAGRPAAALAGRRSGALGFAGLALAAGLALEAVPAGPDWIPYFNRLAGDAARRERLLNDSNVDWGQGLVALRDEMTRLGIGRIHLAYHGTTDPAVYGIDYVPYLGGAPGPESDWLAISSYFYVGLPARVMTPDGYTRGPVNYDARALWNRPAAAHPAGCMWLFRLR